MAKWTMGFGALLIAIGVAGYLTLGAKLHPVWTGLALLICGLLANTEDAKRRMLFMHLAVTVGLIGFLLPGVMSVIALVKAHTGSAPIINPALLDERILVALVCLVYVVLCVRSFIAARRARA
jgi:hypothetical protein